MYKERRNLIGKRINNLPSVQAAMGLAATSNNKIHIIESLTGYRKQLFGRINDFKRKNNYKCLWTANGKIMLKAHDSSETKKDCLSEWRNVPAGAPQGTKLEPMLFILVIDDIFTSNTVLWKYVDDTTIAECVDKKEDSRIQSDVEELIATSNQNKFQLNESKCKELRISFAKSAADFAPIVINGKAM